MAKIKNPLHKRLPRELRREWKKYIVLFLLLTVTIGSVSGLLVANNSMETELLNAYEKYSIEDGHFTLSQKPTEELLTEFSKEGIQVYEQYCKDLDEKTASDETSDTVIRIFKIRNELNRACLMEGELPQKDDEIAIDRMHASNRNIKVGDTIFLNDKKMTVSGLVALSDYSTLYKNSSDTMFDAITFDIGLVTDKGFGSLKADEVFQYSFRYADPVTDKPEKKARAEELAKKLGTLAKTGGMTDDPDEAKALSDKIDEWTDLIEEVQKKGDALNEEKEALEKEGELLKKEAEELNKEAESLKADALSFKQKQTRIIKVIAPAAAAMGVTLDEKTVENNTLDISTIRMFVSYLPESFQKTADDFLSKAEDLENRQKELEEKGNDLKERSDDLEARGEDLKNRARELEPMIDEAKAAGDELKALEKYEEHQNEITDYVPEYLNQAIHFAPDDFGHDRAMVEVLLVILVVVLAFIFAITANNTIVSESSVIGTLRASGYTKAEMVRHYMTMPVLITILAAVCGNILGYSVLKDVVVMMYYNSYSLPTYKTIWNADAFIRTTLYPVVIMVAVNLLVIVNKLKFSPLRFLRHDLSSRRKKRAIKLPDVKFMSRFRLRILFQNATGYVVLFLGITFVCILLGFAIGLPSTLDNYQSHAESYMLVDHQYILKETKDEDGNIITTDEKTAERYSQNSLLTIDKPHIGENVTVYGYSKDSRYFDIKDDLSDDEVYVSQAYADKFKLTEGQVITLKDEFSDTEYDFKVKGIYDLPGTIGVLLPIKEFNRIFDKEDDDFTGYLSENKIEDIDEEYILTVITIDDVLKISNQLDHSMGGYMDYFSVICFFMALLIIYLLTKMIIEKNAASISMVKVLGYENREINSLYISITTVVAIVSAILGAYISKYALKIMWANVMNRLNGWFEFYISLSGIVKMIVIVVVAYYVVSFFDMMRIKKIPLTEALKNVE